MFTMNAHKNQRHRFVSITMSLKKHAALFVALFTFFVLVAAEGGVFYDIIVHEVKNWSRINHT